LPRRALDPFWIERIRFIAVNDPDRTLKSITDQLEVEGKEMGRDDYPSDRTIRRYREEIRAASIEEQSAYLRVRWPETFETGLLPWEAARTILGIMRYREFPPTPPPLGFARWCWRIYLADPGLEAVEILALSRLLTFADGQMVRDPKAAEEVRRQVENYLFAPASDRDPESFKVPRDWIKEGSLWSCLPPERLLADIDWMLPPIYTFSAGGAPGGPPGDDE
jgi:hypothetical protein